MMEQQQNYIQTHVVQKKTLSQALAILTLKPSHPFEFKPGQYCTVVMDEIARPYSICSAPHEGLLELFLEIVPDELRQSTSLTPKLFHLNIGDTVFIRKKAKGLFLLDPTASTHVFVATVTGIAPFISMIRSYVHGYYQPMLIQEPFYVFQGASYGDEFGYDAQLKSLETTGVLRYIPTVSRPNEERNQNWHGKTGRVNLILEPYLEEFKIGPKNTMIYLCGHRGMIEYLGNHREKSGKPLGTLVKKGYQTKEEIYF